MTDELKPCPFCGGENLEEDAIGRISCTGCGATAPYGYHTTETWNTRADLPATDEQASANEKVKALVEALVPYAALAKHHAADAPEWGPFCSITARLSIRNLREVRAALAALEK